MLKEKWVLSFLFFLLSCSSQQKHSEGFQPQPFEEYQLANGMDVLLIRDDRLPYVSYGALLKSGSATDPAGQAGLMNLTAKALDRGTRTMSANEIAEQMNQMATDFDASVAPDYSYFKVSSLSNYQQELIKLFGEVLLDPAFAAEEVARLRTETISTVTRLPDSPGAFADVAFRKFLFGESSYGSPRMGTRKSLEKLDARELKTQYQKWFRPNNMIFTVVGHFDSQIKSQIEQAFGRWGSSKLPQMHINSPTAINGFQIELIDKPDITQAQVRFGHLGISRDNPDYLKLRLANTILGSGFSSRLVSRVRDQLGLTYNISSGFDAFATAGAFEISTFTRNDQLGRTIQETLSTLQQFCDQGATDAEVFDAKEFMIGQFPQAVETPEDWAYNLQILRVYHVPDSYLTDFIKNISAISTSDVNAVIKKYLHPSDLKILAYTAGDKVKDQLKKFGSYETRPYKEIQ